MVEGQAQHGRARRELRRATSTGLLGAGLWLVSAAIASAAPADLRADPCAAWPGEPTLLPRTVDADPFRARWAALRVRELSEAASVAEAESPIRAHRLWRRVLCLEPANDAAAAGLSRTPLVSVHQPPLLARGAQEPSGDPWADLDRPLAIRRPPPQRVAAAAPSPSPDRPAAPADLEEIVEPAPPPDPMGDAIEDVQEYLRAAQFEEALIRAERGRRELGDSANPQRAAELEVLSATAALALDRRDEATESLRRALAADPMLNLDPMETPPKVRRAFDRVRAGASL